MVDDGCTAALAMALEISTSSANPTTPIHAGMAAWSEAELRAFFGAEALGPSPGGRLEAIQSSSSASGAVFSSQPWMQPPVPPKPPEPAPADTGQQGAIDGSLWRIDHDLRRTHWLCEHCNVALPRETAILCTRCGCASHASSHLDAAAAAQLFSHLSEARAANSLVALDVSHNPLGAVGAAALARLLRSLPFLTSLDCSGTSASDAGAIAICDALRSDHAGRSGNQCHGKPPMEGAAPPLRTLNLMGCSIKSAGAAALARLLSSAPRSDGYVDAEEEPLGSPPRLREVSTRRNRRGGSDQPSSRVRGALPSLVELGLGWNQIRGPEAKLVADAVLGFRSGQLQVFCGMPVGRMRTGELPPVPPLSEFNCQRRPTVEAGEELHLQGGGCGPAGAYVVASMLPLLAAKGGQAGRPPLRAVVMPFQSLGDEGAEEIARACALHCPQLSFLMLSRNEVSHEATCRIRELLPHLDELRLRINNRGG